MARWPAGCRFRTRELEEDPMRYAALSDVGKVRERNEDFYHADGRLFIVADGMGGHQAGDVASSAAVEEFLRCEKESRGVDPLRRLRGCLQAANRVILKMAEKDPGLRGMGTTFTVLLLEDGAYLGHVGDSRAYVLRGGTLNPLTRDHSLVEKMVREGFLTAREARRHPKRNIILRALGLSADLAADLVRVEVMPGDRILLCTDGLTSQLEDDQLARLLLEEEDPEACARKLVEAANALGGEDNVTVILVDLEEGDGCVFPAKGAVSRREEKNPVARWWRHMRTGRA